MPMRASVPGVVAGAIKAPKRSGPTSRAMAGVLAWTLLVGMPGAGNWAHAQEAGPAVLTREGAQHEGQGTPLHAWSDALWTAARAGQATQFMALLKDLRDGGVLGVDPLLQTTAQDYLRNIEKREEERAKQLGESREELEKLLTGEQTTPNVIKALREVLEIQSLSASREAVLQERPIADLLTRAEQVARQAEGDQDILNATEIFVYLDALNDVAGTFRPHVRRLALRQEMLRMYVPKRLWELQNERRKAAGDKELPPFNSLGQDYRDRLASVTPDTVVESIRRSVNHVEQVGTIEVVQGGLEALRTMLTTRDLELAFPGLRNEQARREMLAAIDRESAELRKPQDEAARPAGSPRNLGRRGEGAVAAAIEPRRVDSMLTRLLTVNERTVQVPEAAIVHEFGNGSMGRLDEYTAIIWPDELARFNRSTQGKFVGIGVQIELDDLLNVRVVTPLDGSPAQRQGIQNGDLITKVDGKSIFGLSLDQVVDVITGREGTQVVLTIERPLDDAPAKADAPSAPEGEGEKIASEPPKRQEMQFVIQRATIQVSSVKGWKRVGVGEDDWNYFIDEENRIGYLRLSQFSDKTTDEIDRAVQIMKRQGLKGLIFDLRFNPGGLLDQAISVAQRFLPFDHEPIVSAKRAGGIKEVEGYTNSARASLADMPVIILTNEGSASASEIVSGAVSVFSRSREQDVDALVLGARTFGKGSVQNVWPITNSSLMKLTTAYYMLPDDQIIHRRPGRSIWGVEPNMKVEMLPKQTSDAIILRRNADLPPGGQYARLPGGERPNPDDLLTKGIDLQLEAATLLLHARVRGQGERIAEDPRP